MTGKPHFYMEHGYWHCRCDGFHGCGWRPAGAFDSCARQRRWWFREMELSYDT